ncbi:28S ribosomal protein S5, mitochondrial [Malassezia psittaci]|uniref:Small ribosomal subunit protein uS5m n=1 Tax=Malassezia psittaci TaxID=1821823 RepID=A0AAF0FCH6_9BASI|nr:28S ribosomal protein S5, mitochondrial [Malassezia psittaci]
MLAQRTVGRMRVAPRILARWKSSAPNELAKSQENRERQPSPSAMQKALPIMFSRLDLESFPRLLNTRNEEIEGSGANVLHKAPDARNPYGANVAIYNEVDDRQFPTPPVPIQNVMRQSGGAGDEVNSEAYLSSVTPLTAAEVQALHRYNITLKRVVNMTGKGRVASWYSLVVAGNGKGLVGYGEGKDMNAGRANKKAFHAAVKNMDLVSVHRAKSGANTVETSVEGNWGATRVVIRPRPSGFGLRVPNVIHPIARAAGFTDLSAAVYGSSNAMNVVKAALQVLWGGSAPIGMGNGIRGKMRRDNKGQGARSRRDMELSRGRRLEELDMSR